MQQELFERAISFIRSLGIDVQYRTIEAETFLPGILIDMGSLVIDLARLKYPGDVLHEAGHIAVVPANERPSLTGDAIALRTHRSAEEMMAIAWSFAACKHLDIDPHFVFHGEGYQGGGANIAQQFGQGNYFGVPMLQWARMSAEPHQAEKLGLPAFPLMAKWLMD